MAKDKTRLSRRDFFKASGMLAAAAAGSVPALGGLEAASAQTTNSSGKWESAFSACDMCFNKCGCIVRVQDGVVKNLIPTLNF